MAGEKETAAQQSFDFETMSIVVYVLLKHNITMGNDVFKMMSAADGKRGEAGFQHQFRKVKKRAGEILAKANGGEIGSPVAKSRGGSSVGTPATGETKGRKPRGKNNKRSAEEDDDEAEGTPTKKPKAEAEDEDDGFA